MNTIEKHPVLGDIEMLPVEEAMSMPTIMIEAIEIIVLLTVLYIFFHKFKNYFPKHKRHLNPED